ncbi:MAG: sirohydrochlorin cobaltochelatase [Clostridiales bacterium]|nr:sirohydrochlorin cobaltochelatase [Clostridiales bacterium]
MTENKAVLAVSFGTSRPKTRRRTVEAVERDLAGAFPDRRFFRAWTSGMIRNKVRKEEGISVLSPAEALDAMRRDGIDDVIVQPTMTVPGDEYDLVIKTVSQRAGMFAEVRMGKPLLSDEDDIASAARAVEDAYGDIGDDSVLALMAHGSAGGDTAYGHLAERFRSDGYGHFIIGTAENGPGFASILDTVREKSPRRVVLAPLLLSAGMHALRDMAGDGADSWRSRLETEGYSVECRLTGLGELKAVRDIFILHANKAVSFGSPKGDGV